MSGDTVYLVPKEIIGNCPVCGGHLKRNGENLECSGGDYIIPEKDFDRIWESYSLERLRSEDGAADSLLRELQEANIK